MENNKDKIFVGGDISGIQSFIYNITSKKAALSLKGRSARLDEYLEEVCDKICNISPQRTEKIYCGGGKFYIIVPNEESVKERIIAIHKEEEKNLWEKHYGQLAINIAIVEPLREEFGENFREANKQFAKQKNSKFKSIITEDYDKFFEVQKVGGSPEVCAVTGIEADKLVSIPDEKNIKVLPSVLEQIELGQKIRKEQHLKDTFEDYAKDSYLGILRMDVDDLGAAFQSCKTLDEYKKFSEHLTDFFKEYLTKTLWYQPIKGSADTFHDWTDIIYAGGDDVFIVGRWNIVIQFAELIRNEFVKKIPKHTLSAGIAIVGAKFPISKAAELAGEAEESAKKYGNGTEKNAFCFLGQTVSWKDEFETVKKQKEEFYTLCKDKGMPRSILHKIMQFNEMRLRGEMSYLWNSAYYLKRFSDRNDKIEGVGEQCNKLKKTITEGSQKDLQQLALAARWAELELREIITNKKS